MKNVGIDIVEIERVKKAISASFEDQFLSIQEKQMCKDYSIDRKIKFVAGRFAAKEAIIKCLVDEEDAKMSDLNIENNEKGKPYINYKDYSILLSISHENNYAVAVAILQ